MYHNSTIGDNDNNQSHDQEESKLNSIVFTDGGIHTLIDGKITKKSIQLQ